MISFLDIKPYNCFIRGINSPTRRTPVMFGEYIRVPYFTPSSAISNHRTSLMFGEYIRVPYFTPSSAISNHRTSLMFGEYIRVPYFAPSSSISNLGIYEWLMSEATKSSLDNYRRNYGNLIIVVLENRYFLWR